MWILLKRQKWSFFSCRKIGSNQLPSWRVYAFGCSCFYPRTVYLCNTKNAGGANSESTLQFLIRRWFSLMKAFWPVYVFVFFGYWIVRGNPMRVYENSVIRMIADVFAVSDFFQTGLLSGVWWYMCLAQIIVLLIPLIDSLCERLGMAVVPIGFLLPQFIPDSIHSKYGGSYLNYFLVILLAAACAKGDVLNN